MYTNNLYEFDKETGTILYYKGTANECLAVPETIDGVVVRHIGEYAFCKSRKLCVIILPETIETIGRGAFFDCKSLVSINIPEKVKKIEPKTFFNNKNLEYIYLKNSEVEIDDTAFLECVNFNK